MNAKRIVELILDDLSVHERREVEYLLCNFLLTQGYYVAANEGELRDLALDNTDLKEEE